MHHAILLGQFELAIDEKNRLLVPSEIRKSLHAVNGEDYLYINVGPTNGKPWLYPPKIYESFVERMQPAMVPDADELAFLLAYFPSSARLEWDKQGRVLIPEIILRQTGTGREIMMVGVGNHLQIWNRSDWNTAAEERKTKGSSEASARWKQAMLPPNIT